MVGKKENYFCRQCSRIFAVDIEESPVCKYEDCGSSNVFRISCFWVDTNNPYEEVWRYILKYLNSDLASELFESRIDNGFYFIDTDSIRKGKKREKTRKPITRSTYKKQVEYFIQNVKQSYRFFKAADLTTVEDSPILLYYGSLSFIKALYSATYEYEPTTKEVHGLSYEAGEVVKIMKHPDSVFAKLLDCTTDSRVFDKYTGQAFEGFSISKLFGNIPPAKRMASEIIPNLKREYDIIPPYAYYLLLFYLSNVQRYNFDLWEDVIERRNPFSAIYLDILELSKKTMPIFFLNRLRDDHYDFARVAYLGPGEPVKIIQGVYQ